MRPDVVAAPAALVGRDFRVAGDVGLYRARQGAVARDADFHRAGHMIDALHDLELFVLHILGVFVVIGLGLDEKRRSTGIAVRGLHHEVAAEAGRVRRGHELPVGLVD